MSPDAAADLGVDDARLQALLHDWQLTPRGSVHRAGSAAALRVSRRGVSGATGAALLRITGRSGSPESTEHIVLRRWAGAGAVRLLAADPARAALLLEDPAPGTDLTRLDLIEACEHLGALLHRLSIPATAPLPTVGELLAELPRALHDAAEVLPRRMIDEALAQARALGDGAVQARVVPTALDFRTVVSATREPFLTTSGLALSGDPEYAIAAAVWDRAEEAARAHRLRAHLRLRIEVICDVAGLDERRARAYTFIRTAARIAVATRRGTAVAPDVTAAIATLKAMQG